MDPPAVEDRGEGANVADGGLLERRALDRGGLPLAVPPSVRLVAVPACQPVFIGREWTHLATERCSLPLLALGRDCLLKPGIGDLEAVLGGQFDANARELAVAVHRHRPPLLRAQLEGGEDALAGPTVVDIDRLPVVGERRPT